MSVPDHQLDTPTDFFECSTHRWVYPAGSICQKCLNDINDEYADQAVQDRLDERETNP